VDLSTVDGMRKSMLDVRPGDIIYIEPHKKIVTESLRDVTMVLTSLTSIITLILLVINIK
jgi:polysaccharide export outer membrane protein